MVRLYNQKSELLYSIQDIEVLFDETDIRLYNYTQKQLSKLKTFGERSEVWLNELLIDLDNDKDFNNVVNIISNLN